MSFFSGGSDFWQTAWPIVGWTMLWFLALGTIVLIVGAILRVLLKRANSQVRYVTSLAGFAVLALLPILIAGYLTTSLPRDITRSSRPGLNEITTITELKPNIEPTNRIDLNNLPIVNREAKRVGDERAAKQTTIQNLAIPSWDNRAMLNSILHAIVSYLPWLWLVGTPLTFLLLATGLLGAERLRKSCQTLTDGPILAACERVRAQLGIARQVGVAICHSVSSPLLIGIVKPLILLPPAALTGWTTDELEMVLLHELAHVRRWDNAVNLVQRIVESLLFFHPATWIMSNWVRRDREDCCDAVVVGQTAKPQAYAELLLTLASHQPGLATSVAMAQHPIASRIRRILKIEDEPMLISRKALTLGVTIILATVLLAFALPASEAEESSLPRKRGERAKVSRESKRVADERSAEETTNPTNNTNQDLTTEDTESTERWPDKTAVFPNPIEAEIAAQAWKMLRLKTIPATLEEEEAAKSQKLKAGVKVVDGPFRLGRPFPFFLTSVNKDNISSYRDLAIALGKIEKEQLTSTAIAIVDAKFKVRFQIMVDVTSPTETTNPANDTNKDLATESTEELKNLGDSTQKPGTSEVPEQAPTREIFAKVPEKYSVLENHRDIIESIEQQGFKVTMTSHPRDGGKVDYGLRITVPKTFDPRIVWKDSPYEGVRALLIPRKTTSSSLFPTLGEQRAADFAYKLLGVELEKLNEEDLERVKAKGYAGGMIVANGEAGGLQRGDLLIGLHVWPTESLDQVQEILQRDDLYQLSPLKYYVIRKVYGGENLFSGDSSGKDEVITGRIQVDLDAWAEKEGFKQERLKQSRILNDSGPAPPSWPEKNSGDNKQSSLLYDGKTFEQWRNLWTTELKTEKRVECIKALAAFGRAGRGKEASEAILDVTAEFDFGNFEGSSAQDLKEAVSQVIAGDEGIDGQYWLPQLIERLKSDPAKWSSFAEWVLEDARGKNVAPYLKQIARDPNISDYARAGAIAGLAFQKDITDDAESMTMIREVLTDGDPKMIPTLISNLNFTRLDLFPEQAELLIHKNDQIRNAAWGQLRRRFDPAEGMSFLETFLAMIDDPTRKEDHARAIEALGLLSGPFGQGDKMRKRQPEVVDKLTQLLIDGDVELLPATLLARSKLGAQSTELLIKNLEDKITKERRQQLEQAAKKAEELEDQQDTGMGGMGSGGMGGGGGMF